MAAMSSFTIDNANAWMKPIGPTVISKLSSDKIRPSGYSNRFTCYVHVKDQLGVISSHFRADNPQAPACYNNILVVSMLSRRTFLIFYH